MPYARNGWELSNFPPYFTGDLLAARIRAQLQAVGPADFTEVTAPIKIQCVPRVLEKVK
jgi:hypothetical protein